MSEIRSLQPAPADGPSSSGNKTRSTTVLINRASNLDPDCNCRWIMASVSPKHDTHPIMVAAGVFAVSILGADQIDIGQYFSYPGRRFRHIAT